MEPGRDPLVLVIFGATKNDTDGPRLQEGAAFETFSNRFNRGGLFVGQRQNSGIPQ